MGTARYVSTSHLSDLSVGSICTLGDEGLDFLLDAIRNRFLHVDRSVVCNALLDYDIFQPQADPFARTPSPELNDTDITDNILDPDLPIPRTLPDDIMAKSSHASGATAPHPISFTGPLSTMTDDELDELVIRL